MSTLSYIEKLWGASHDFWGSLWLTLYGLAGNNDLIVHVVGKNDLIRCV